jgi:hypothetical protein
MKSAGGAGLVIVGFLFLYLAISGKLDCFFTFVSCVTGANNPSAATAGGTGNTSGSGGINWGQIINTGIDIFNGQHGANAGASPLPNYIRR